MKYIKELNKDNLKEIIEVLDNDGVIIFPTDTVYGIGCNQFSIKALNKLFEFKQRDYTKPINVLTDSIDKIKLVSTNISSKEMEIMNKYFPSDLTIILNKKDNVPDILTANLNTIGVRIPNSDIALTILKEYKYPIATTSVNISGEKPSLEVKDFYDDFKDKVDIIVEGGKSKIGIPSTIIKIENNNVNVLRQGNLKVE